MVLGGDGKSGSHTKMNDMGLYVDADAVIHDAKVSDF